MSLQESGEMYLESIYVLSKKKTTVRAIDVGEYLGYSKPSVSRAMGILKNGNYITVESDGNIKLTQEGEKIAQTMFERHMLLTKFLIQLGVDEKTASDDACKIEHAISEKSFNALKKHIENN
ncbi:MAG: metal-dependent transcriptional regulator [Ruminococcaceae bacterium]|nr:metal-dependent transcriptional regulator [Oscillospiraceae bacterium]